MTTDDKPVTIYDSPYLSEFYELRWARGLGLEDVDFIYWPALKELIASPPRQGQFTFLDVGTGGGRAILGLLNKAVEAELEIPAAAQIIGMDISENMLDQAVKEAKKYPRVAPVIWSLGSALALEELPPLADKSNTVDLLIFTFGSIAHLMNDGEIEQFFDQVARVLTPGTGRAYISFYDRFFVPHGGKMPTIEDFPIDQDSLPPTMQNKEIPSAQWPGILYRMKTTKAFFDGCCHVMEMKIQAVKGAGSADEEVVENNTCKYRLRVFTEDHINNSATTAGLEIMDVRRFEEQNIFVFRNSA
jgi:SAM-dependent methyltransferase